MVLLLLAVIIEIASLVGVILGLSWLLVVMFMGEVTWPLIGTTFLAIVVFILVLPLLLA